MAHPRISVRIPRAIIRISGIYARNPGSGSLFPVRGVSLGGLALVLVVVVEIEAG